MASSGRIIPTHRALYPFPPDHCHAMTQPSTGFRPTNIRILIVAVAMLAAVLLYLERVCMSVAEVYIREDLRIGKSQMDLAFGAFFIAYALGQVPSGWLSQRYGPRLMMTLYMIGWSVFGVFIALAQDFTTLFIARFMLGLSQAGAYPTAALIVKRWVPDRNRGLASSIVAFGGRFGGAGANWLTGILIVAFVPITTPATITSAQVLDAGLFAKQLEEPADAPIGSVRATVRREFFTATIDPEVIAAGLNRLIETPNVFGTVAADPQMKLATDGEQIARIPSSARTSDESQRLNRLVLEKAFPGSFMQLHTEGWRPTLLVYGVLGVLVGGVFWLFTRNWPREHPWANQAEVDLIESGQSKVGEANVSDAIPFQPLLRSRNQWLFSLNNFTSNFGWVFLITLMPRFLEEQYQVPVDQRGLMTTIPLFLASFGMVVGGWFTDRLTVSFGRRWGRAIPMGLFKIPCFAALFLVPFMPSAWAAVFCFSVMSVCQDFGIPAVWAFAQDTAGKQVGAVLGWANMWGNFGAGIAVYSVGTVADGYGWDTAMALAAGSYMICTVTGILANASIPLFPAGGEVAGESTPASTN